MAKPKKEIEVPVRVSLDTSQVADLSSSVEDFVEGLSTSVELFCDGIKEAFSQLAFNIQDDCEALRRNIPNLPAYTPDEDDVHVDIPEDTRPSCQRGLGCNGDCLR